MSTKEVPTSRRVLAVHAALRMNTDAYALLPCMVIRPGLMTNQPPLGKVGGGQVPHASRKQTRTLQNLWLAMPAVEMLATV